MKGLLPRSKKNWSLLSAFFSESEVDQLRLRLSTFRPRHLFFCSFENRFAKSGGLAPVTINALPSLEETGRLERVSLLSPFYPNLMDAGKLSASGLAFEVRYGDQVVRVDLLQLALPGHGSKGRLNEYFLRADGFFDARNSIRDPYLYLPDDPGANDAVLRDNALFFCRAVPRALAALGATKDTVLHLQEWQTALLSFTAKDAMLEGVLESCGTVQTIHNPYDSFITKAALARLTTDPQRRARVDSLPGEGRTAFEIGLQMVDAPVTTVSENFAVELTQDIVQTQYFAPHLRAIFEATPVIGVNNGPFVRFSAKFPRLEQHSLDEIARIKTALRAGLIEVLDRYNPPERFGELTYRGGSILDLPLDVPVVVMSGRLDLFQKGYDTLLRALARFATDEIKAVLSPMPVRASDLAFFHEMAIACRGNVTVFPMRMEHGYSELQDGATFGMMPSIYEPFGAAIEFMAHGTPNIVRATGGLVDQVVHGENGFCFRERPDSYDLAHIRDFVRASSDVASRTGNAWATDMADALYTVLRDATTLYRDRRDDYHTMILRGFAKARTFSWQANAETTIDVYERIAVLD